jgi:hypothetical protein
MQMKRSVEFVVYHKVHHIFYNSITITDLVKQNGQPRACLQHQVDTYPILSLGDLKYLADYGLDEKSCLSDSTAMAPSRWRRAVQS